MWIDVKLRSPRKLDGDCDGDVLFLYDDHSVTQECWSLWVNPNVIAWMTNPPFTPRPEIPSGYRLLGQAEYNQQQHPEAMYLINDGGWRYIAWSSDRYDDGHTYIVPVEPKYRPFRDGEEFRPHRERWWRAKVGRQYIYPPQSYCATRYGQGERLWKDAFTELEFDDGTPFGVEVTE